MKKIVGILGMAAVLASAAFADAPAANFVCTDFSGAYDFGVKANFLPKDVEFGMYNTPSMSIKFGFTTAGAKATTGDGVWGDLAISSKATDATALPTVDIDRAKIHFINGDFSVALNVVKPDLKLAGYGAKAASASAAYATAPEDVTGELSNGFKLELAMDNLFSFNVRFMDKGLQNSKNQQYGMALDASLKAVENLAANVGAAFNFKTKNIAMAADAAYTLKINDKLYVAPGVGFAMYKADGVDPVNQLEAGLLFGWGVSDQEPGFKYVTNKTNEGLSVAFKTDLKKGNFLAIGLYDQSLLSLLDADGAFGVLKSGLNFVMDLEGKANTLNAGVKYDVTFSPVYVSLGADVRAAMVADKDAVMDYKISARIGSKEVIDNVDLYAQYDYAKYGDPAKDDKGVVTDIDTNALSIGTKISF